VTDEYRVHPGRIEDEADLEVVRAATAAVDREHPPPPGMAWSLAWDRDGNRDPQHDQAVFSPQAPLEPADGADFEPFPLVDDPASFRDLAELLEAYRALLGSGLRHAVRVPAAVAVLVLPDGVRPDDLASWYGLALTRIGHSLPGPHEFTGSPSAVAALLRAVAP
jgi:hypothetical protein